jgi:hypothetical protein
MVGVFEKVDLFGTGVEIIVKFISREDSRGLDGL